MAETVDGEGWLEIFRGVECVEESSLSRDVWKW